jgi:hypothetical protein
MTTLFENPLPILVVGGLLATFAIIVFLARRSGASLAALIAVVALTAALLVVERVVVTEREQVEVALATMLDAIESNDVAGAVACVDPAAAAIRRDIEALMPMLKVEAANSAAEQITLDESARPPTAISQFQAYLRGLHQSSGTPVAYLNQRVDLHWVKRGDQWLLADYTAYWEGQPIDAVSSASGNRAVPGR